MTKTITLRSCHFLIALWIIVSVITFMPINYYHNIISSIDENGCRISLQDDKQVICPDLPIQRDQNGNIICTKCIGWGTMSSPESLYGLLYMFIIFEIFFQIVAFFGWNVHFKWFKFEVKSCWNDKPKTN